MARVLPSPSRASDIAEFADEGMKVLTSKAFQAKLGLLIAQVEPLKEGMRQYAMQVVPHPKAERRLHSVK
ncbi:hypothetical protein Agabi119p4_11257 [Agaricus bisporus var. burnettii]|uniref:Uncharacterized protein n=1 Tax=Agaricus bisporus var. burnettii TaxID=192524 RepID=A0A8H7C235_AGABI|nr:hypothetical protein Agabi119p4_11257 [Agaricus bisporus var. burnettii]